MVRTTDSRHGHAPTENTPGRRFEPGETGRVWAGDITSIATGEGWLHLAAVVDLGRRRGVGWATADPLRAELVGHALSDAPKHRRPVGSVLHHSDRGVP